MTAVDWLIERPTVVLAASAGLIAAAVVLWRYAGSSIDVGRLTP